MLPLEEKISAAARQHVPPLLESIGSLPDRLRLLELPGEGRAGALHSRRRVEYVEELEAGKNRLEAMAEWLRISRIWYEMRKGDTKLKDECRYLVRRPNEIFLNEGESPPVTGQSSVFSTASTCSR